MKRETIRKLLPITLLGTAVVISVLYLVRVSTPQDGNLKASGTVETVQVVVAPEVSGRVAEVMVAEGDEVELGDPLFRLEDDLLRTRRAQIVALGQATIVAAELQVLIAEQALADLNEDWPIMAAQADLAVARARDALDDVEYKWTVRQEGNRASSNTIKGAEANLILANEEVETAEQRYEHTRGEGSRALALSNLVAAKQHRDSIQRNLNWYLGSPDETEQALLDTELAEAEAILEAAEREYEKLKEGPDRDVLELANARLKNAKAQLDLAKAQAEADIAVIDLQLADLLIRAPVQGTVLNRSIEAGEVLIAGGAALTLADLEKLTITVYIAEDQYGTISLGQKALVKVDSFPNIAFEAIVEQIADTAEFTPRNVQTEEGRRTMVFAIDLRVRDPLGLLKPGMPGDVVFNPE
jgi:multidrug resistance efflux pump